MDHDPLLKTLLHEMKDGVVVCDPAGIIILYNEAAADLFVRGPALGREKSLYSYCFQPPIEKALSLLQYQHGLKKQTAPIHYVQFMNASVSQEQYFRCRVSFLPPVNEAGNSFVIILEDISSWHIPDNPLLMKIEEFRAPMTNLRAAVENLTEYPEMSPVMRSAFENVLVQESLNLTETFASLARSCRAVMQTQNHLTTLDTEVLFGYVTSSLQALQIAVAAAPKPAIAVKVDFYGLLLVLDYLADKIKHKQKHIALSCKMHIGEQFIYFDFIWPGPFIPPADIRKLLEKKLARGIGAMTVASILHAMEGDIWSQQLENSTSMLRLALPIAIRAGKTT